MEEINPFSGRFIFFGVVRGEKVNNFHLARALGNIVSIIFRNFPCKFLYGARVKEIFSKSKEKDLGGGKIWSRGNLLRRRKGRFHFV